MPALLPACRTPQSQTWAGSYLRPLLRRYRPWRQRPQQRPRVWWWLPRASVLNRSQETNPSYLLRCSVHLHRPLCLLPAFRLVRPIAGLRAFVFFRNGDLSSSFLDSFQNSILMFFFSFRSPVCGFLPQLYSCLLLRLCSRTGFL